MEAAISDVSRSPYQIGLNAHLTEQSDASPVTHTNASIRKLLNEENYDQLVKDLKDAENVALDLSMATLSLDELGVKTLVRLLTESEVKLTKLEQV